MPRDEFDDKWACEPCIRGHRSSKCGHYERFMVRVKRPGRPQNTCSHRGNCTCQQVERVIMVRVPRSADGCRCTRLDRNDPHFHDFQRRAALIRQMDPDNPPIAIGHNPHAGYHAGVAVANVMMPNGERYADSGQYQQHQQVLHHQQQQQQQQQFQQQQEHAELQRLHLHYQQQLMADQQRGHHAMNLQGHFPSLLSHNYHDVAAATNQFRDMNLGPNLHPFTDPAGQPNVPSNDFAAPHPEWNYPNFNFASDPIMSSNHMPDRNSSTLLENGAPSNSSYWPEDRPSEAPALERYSEESNAETSIGTPSVHERFATNVAGSEVTASLHNDNDDDKSGEGEFAAGNLLQATIDSAPQTTMYPISPNYATIRNPLTLERYNALQASGSWTPLHVPYYAGTGVGEPAASPAKPLEEDPPLFECPCGDGCTCLLCTAHPHNTTSYNWAHDLWEISGQPQSELEGRSSPATVIDEQSGSRKDKKEDPTLLTTEQTFDHDNYNLTEKPFEEPPPPPPPRRLEQHSSYFFAYGNPLAGNLDSSI